MLAAEQPPRRRISHPEASTSDNLFGTEIAVYLYSTLTPCEQLL
jgi:hypothetical protein